MKNREKTPYYDKNGKQILVGDLIYYTESPARYADSMALIIKRPDGEFCQAAIVWNASASEDHGRYQFDDITRSSKVACSMRHNERGILSAPGTIKLLDTEILDLEQNKVDLSDSKFLIDYMNEKFPLP